MGALGEAPTTSRTPSDGSSLAEGPAIEAVLTQYNGTTLDLVRGNIAETLAASAAQDGTTNHAGTNYNHSAALIVVDATASSGDGTEDLDVNIQIQDPASSKWVTIIADTPFTNGATETMVYGIGLGLSDTQTVFQEIEEIPLPRDFRVQTVVQQGGAGTPTYTYSVGVLYAAT